MSNNEIEINGELYVKKSSAIEYKIPESEFPPWETGTSYHIETVTKYFTGLLVGITETDFIITDAAWIPSTGNFSDYCKGAKPEECEPFADDQVVMVSRSGYISAVKRELVLEMIR